MPLQRSDLWQGWLTWKEAAVAKSASEEQRNPPIKFIVRCIEFSTCLLAFGVLLLLVQDATLHPYGREAISIAIILSSCAFARLLYDLRSFWLHHRWLGRLEMHAIDRMKRKRI